MLTERQAEEAREVVAEIRGRAQLLWSKLEGTAELSVVEEANALLWAVDAVDGAIIDADRLEE